MQVTKDSVVSIRFILKNSRGEVLENTMNGDPVSYLQGSAGIEPLLQAQLDGLQRGDKKAVLLSADSGLVSEDFTCEIIVDDVRMASASEILLGYPVQLPADRCDTDCACYL
jgi:FKBP-type peptidyl-prolyl cis-trans isomerase 2